MSMIRPLRSDSQAFRDASYKVARDEIHRLCLAWTAQPMTADWQGRIDRARTALYAARPGIDAIRVAHRYLALLYPEGSGELAGPTVHRDTARARHLLAQTYFRCGDAIRATAVMYWHGGTAIPSKPRSKLFALMYAQYIGGISALGKLGLIVTYYCPRWTRGHRALAELALRLDRPVLAQRHARHALALNPNDHAARNLLMQADTCLLVQRHRAEARP